MTNIPTTIDERGHKVIIVSRYSHCGAEWTSVWDSACDDECTVCGHGISPYEFEEVPIPEQPMTTNPTTTTDRFTDAQLAEVREIALTNDFRAFTNHEGRTTYIRPDDAFADTIEELAFDNECVWLDRYVRNPDESIKAEADGSASTITELIATIFITDKKAPL